MRKKNKIKDVCRDECGTVAVNSGRYTSACHKNAQSKERMSEKLAATSRMVWVTQDEWNGKVLFLNGWHFWFARIASTCPPAAIPLFYSVISPASNTHQY